MRAPFAVAVARKLCGKHGCSSSAAIETDDHNKSQTHHEGRGSVCRYPTYLH